MLTAGSFANTGSSEAAASVDVELGVPADQIEARGASVVRTDVGGAAPQIEAHPADADAVEREDVVVGGVVVEVGDAHPALAEFGERGQQAGPPIVPW